MKNNKSAKSQVSKSAKSVAPSARDQKEQSVFALRTALRAGCDDWCDCSGGEDY